MHLLIENIDTSPTAVCFAEEDRPLNRLLSTRPGRESGEYRLTRAVQVSVQYMRSGDDLLFDGTLSGELAGQCVRCLDEFRLPLRRAFSCVLIPAHQLGTFARETEPSRELKAEDLAASFYSGEQVDVSALVHEQLLLALPSAPRCRDTCKGLCAQCGVNLNVQTCSCRSGWTDPHLAVLSRLRLPAGRTSAGKPIKAHP